MDLGKKNDILFIVILINIARLKIHNHKNTELVNNEKTKLTDMIMTHPLGFFMYREIKMW